MPMCYTSYNDSRSITWDARVQEFTYSDDEEHLKTAETGIKSSVVKVYSIFVISIISSEVWVSVICLLVH